MRSRISDPSGFGRVAVLMGGWSTEREVSTWSGKNVVEALERKGVDASAVDVQDPEVLLGLRSSRFDRVFNILHGTGGEDGTAQAVLDLVGIPYAGTGVLGSALAMDKLRSKRIWRAEGLPTPDYSEVKDEAGALEAADVLGYPFVMKPAADGSSVGITIVKAPEQLGDAYTAARGDGRQVMAEQFIKGDELTVAILDGEALPSVRIKPAGEFYDYHAKYEADDTQYHCPSGVTDEQEADMARIGLHAFDLLGCEGWGRVDFLVDSGRPWLLEINTLPGMTSHSLVPMAAKQRGIEFDDLCWAILETSLEAVS